MNFHLHYSKNSSSLSILVHIYIYAAVIKASATRFSGTTKRVPEACGKVHCSLVKEASEISRAFKINKSIIVSLN